MAYNQLPLGERLSTKAQRKGDCLVWIGDRDQRGYGVIRLNGRRQKAHRVSYSLHVGPIPAGMVVRHACDNPSCVDPMHLLLGTQLQNVEDMLQRGRATRLKGEHNPGAQLTAQQVAQIRARHQPRHPTHSGHALALEFGVSESTISLVVRGRRHPS